MVILVEPNINLISEIKRNYSDIQNVHIFNNAIYYNNDELIELFIPAKKVFWELELIIILYTAMFIFH